MDIELNSVEVRVLGSLIEKELTTPDYYPLSLSALTAACSQKSNREPVMSLDEAAVREAVDSLMKKRLVSEKGGAGSRVPKYAHRLSNKLFEEMDFSRRELAVLGVLMLRGPQTPGELRTRTGRMADFTAVDEVERVLKTLGERDDGPFVTELPRRPGQRERRFAQLFSGVEASEAALAEAAPPADAPPGRLAQLEAEVASLRGDLEALREELAALRRER